MIEKGFLKKQTTASRQGTRITSAISKLLLIMGFMIALVSLIFMLLNLGSDNYMMWIWLPLLVAGIILVLVSCIMNGKILPRKRR